MNWISNNTEAKIFHFKNWNAVNQHKGAAAVLSMSTEQSAFEITRYFLIWM